MKSTSKVTGRTKVVAKKTTGRTKVVARKTNGRTKVTAKASPAATHVAPRRPAPSRREIEIRAYELFAGSGHPHGRDVEFWLEAERQLRRGLKS
jgi:hypothetical protein